MIAAADALLKNSARLNADELAAVDEVERAIETYVDRHMERRGCYGFCTRETRANVLAEVNQRLKSAGWVVDFRARLEPGMLSQEMTHVGFEIVLMPTDEAYAEAQRRSLS